MCGLVGVMGDLTSKDLDIFNQMLIADTFRGVHSTGVAGVGGDKTISPHILKATVAGWDLVDLFKSYTRVAHIGQHILIGHNRHATVGGVTRANAHPFYVQDQIVGAHNGTIQTYSTGDELIKWKEFGTDSEACLDSFAVNGDKKTLKSLFGAWAFVWYDYETNTLNMTRNGERSLSIGWRKNERAIYWASEIKMLEWIADRNSVEIETMDLQPHVIYRFKVPDTIRGEIKPPVLSHYEPRKEVTRRTHHTQSYPHNGGATWQAARDAKKGGGGSADELPFSKTESGPAKSGTTNKDGKVLSNHLRHLSEPNVVAGLITHEVGKFEYRTALGLKLETDEQIHEHVKGKACCICGADITPEERWRSIPVDSIICESCAENSETMEYINNYLGVQVA